MNPRTYEIVTNICLVAAVGAALIFDRFEGSRWLAGGVAISAGMTSIIIYFYNYRRSVEPVSGGLSELVRSESASEKTSEAVPASDKASAQATNLPPFGESSIFKSSQEIQFGGQTAFFFIPSESLGVVDPSINTRSTAEQVAEIVNGVRAAFGEEPPHEISIELEGNRLNIHAVRHDKGTAEKIPETARTTTRAMLKDLGLREPEF
jgi:hypothetical protein